MAARQANVLMAHLTPREGAAALEELKPSVSSLDRLPKQVIAHWDERREELRAASEVPAEAAPGVPPDSSVETDTVLNLVTQKTCL